MAKVAEFSLIKPPHQIDLIQWICGMPKKVYTKAQYGFQRDIPVEDDVTTIFDYGNGATGVFITCTHDVMGTDRLEILGDKGKIVVDNSKKVNIKRLLKPESEMSATMSMHEVSEILRGDGPGAIYEEEMIEFDSMWGGGQHQAVLENFAANILDGTPLIAPGSDGIHGVELANAMHLSSWLNQEVSIPIDEDLYLEELTKRREAERK